MHRLLECCVCVFMCSCFFVQVQTISRLRDYFVARLPKIVYSQRAEEWKSSQQWWNRVMLPWWFSNHCHSAQTMLQLEWSQATLKFHGDEITSNLQKRNRVQLYFFWPRFWMRGNTPTASSILQPSANLLVLKVSRQVWTYSKALKLLCVKLDVNYRSEKKEERLDMQPLFEGCAKPKLTHAFFGV